MDPYWKMSSHHYFILLASNTSLFSAIYGYMFNCHPIKIWLLPMITYVSSVNYWRKPEMGWRRNLDISVTCSAFVCQNTIVFSNMLNTPNKYLYCILIIIAAIMYPIGYLFYWNKWYKMSTLSHMMLHIIGNWAHLRLY
jgi:hypothetical protein